MVRLRLRVKLRVNSSRAFSPGWNFVQVMVWRIVIFVWCLGWWWPAGLPAARRDPARRVGGQALWVGMAEMGSGAPHLASS